MKRFQFKIQPLLRYKEYLEKKAKMEVAKTQSSINMCTKRINESQSHYSKTVGYLDHETEKGISSDRYLFFNNYLKGIDQFIQTETNRKVELKKELSAKQTVLKKKSIDKKVIENLKDRQKEAYYDEMLKTEQRENDDMIIIRKPGKEKL